MGPVWPEQLNKLGFDLNRFSHCRTVGINLTLVEPVSVWDPFDVLLERDSDRCTRADLTLLADTQRVPVVGRCLVHRQRSYQGLECHEKARKLIDAVIQNRGWAVIDFDTRWYKAKNSLSTPAQFLSALERVDLLLTNRLHGMVYAIKAGVPVVAIDAIKGTAKVSAQAKALGWPHCIPIEEATLSRIESAVDECLSDRARTLVHQVNNSARGSLATLQRDFIAAIGRQDSLSA